MASETVTLSIVVKILPSLMANIGIGNLYLIYSTISAGFLTAVYFILPETLGLSLEEIESLFRGKSIAPSPAA